MWERCHEFDYDENQMKQHGTSRSWGLGQLHKTDVFFVECIAQEMLWHFFFWMCHIRPPLWWITFLCFCFSLALLVEWQDAFVVHRIAWMMATVCGAELHESLTSGDQVGKIIANMSVRCDKWFSISLSIYIYISPGSPCSHMDA